MRKHICIDVENAEAIFDFIERNPKYRKKFYHIAHNILSHYRVPRLYDKEEVNDSCKGVTAMKFFKGGDNARLYCKEITNEDGVFYIVAVEMLSKKKDAGVSKIIKSIIEKIASYEYRIVDKSRPTLRKVE